MGVLWKKQGVKATLFNCAGQFCGLYTFVGGKYGYTKVRHLDLASKTGSAW
jgi:hypothetical protein